MRQSRQSSIPTVGKVKATNTSIVFDLEIPIPSQGSMRAFQSPRTGKPVVIAQQPEKLLIFRSSIALLFKACNTEPITGPCKVTIYACYDAPKRSKYSFPPRPDVDKAARAVLDALVISGVIQDDRQVCELTISKQWAKAPRSRIKVDLVK